MGLELEPEPFGSMNLQNVMKLKLVNYYIAYKIGYYMHDYPGTKNPFIWTGRDNRSGPGNHDQKDPNSLWLPDFSLNQED